MHGRVVQELASWVLPCEGREFCIPTSSVTSAAEREDGQSVHHFCSRVTAETTPLLEGLRQLTSVKPRGSRGETREARILFGRSTASPNSISRSSPWLVSVPDHLCGATVDAPRE
ncbi:hypothetical protein MRX96_003464 [Rhipicephalus microplus]